jgi:ppGpp synthetase/RelA/SpoT-type nucleotidyltranferase
VGAGRPVVPLDRAGDLQAHRQDARREAHAARELRRVVDRAPAAELAAAGIKAEVSGRPKHIYSIWKKMRGKELDFTELYDVRAFRVIVADVKTCYTVLGLVHNIWTPIPKEFDDYISRPKPNGYQSLHTVVTAEDGRPLEVQIRTQEMHNFAEYGVAAHWRYKEEGGSNFKSQQYDEKIAWLRQLLAWKSEVADAVTGAGEEEMQREWVEKLKSTTLDDRIFVLTPQARVLELPVGATPIDFAYHLHSEVGHRCRGAKVDGVMVPLNTAAEERPDLRDHHRQGRARQARARRATGSAPATRSAAAPAPRSAPGSTRWNWPKPWRTAARWWKNRCSARARPRSTWKRWRTSWASPRSTICSSRSARKSSACATWKRRCTSR